MNLADTFSITFTILGLVITFVSLWLLSAGLFPRFVQRSAERYGQAPLRLLLLGILVQVPTMFLGAILSGKAPSAMGKVLALSLIVLPLLASFFGSAGLAWRIGEGLQSGSTEGGVWRRMMRGGSVLGLSFVLPVLGTFVLLPYTLLSGFGAFLLCARRRAPAALLATPPPMPVSAASLQS